MANQTPIRPMWLAYFLLAALLAAPGSGASAATVELAGPAGAEVFVDDEAIGFLPLTTPLVLKPGSYLLRCELPGHQPFEVALRLHSNDENKRIRARLMPLRRRTALGINLVFAGLGQHYSGQNLRGWAYNIMEAGGLLTALTGELQRSDFRKDYLLLLAEYGRQINVDRIAEYEQLTLEAYADMEDAEQLRNIGLLVAGGAVVLSLLDSALLFPSFQAGMGNPVASHVPFDEVSPPAWRTVHVGYRTEF
jgi:PEGA domain-containing protein